MSSKKDGGAAFPHGDSTDDRGDGTLPTHVSASQGMTLRDWFAGQAIASVPFRPGDASKDAHNSAVRQSARVAYEIADAMLAERSK